MTTNETAKLRSARELHDPRYLHWPGCGHRRTLADVLTMTCPNCGAITFQGLAPEVTAARARTMLAELTATRQALELDAPRQDRARAARHGRQHRKATA